MKKEDAIAILSLLGLVLFFGYLEAKEHEKSIRDLKACLKSFDKSLDRGLDDMERILRMIY